jgi:hypothetical protein
MLHVDNFTKDMKKGFFLFFQIFDIKNLGKLSIKKNLKN